MKWIKTKCFLLDRKLLDLDVPDSGELARVSIDVSSIESFRETINEGEDVINNEECMVFFKSGGSVVIDMSFDELESIIEGSKTK